MQARPDVQSSRALRAVAADSEAAQLTQANNLSLRSLHLRNTAATGGSHQHCRQAASLIATGSAITGHRGHHHRHKLCQPNTRDMPKAPPEAGRPVINGHRGGHHVHQLSLIAGGHDHHVGQASHVGDVKCSAVGRAICPHQAPTVHGKPYCRGHSKAELHAAGAVSCSTARQVLGERCGTQNALARHTAGWEGEGR